MAVKTYKKGDTSKLSANFKISEFCCKGNGCCSTAKIDTDLVAIVQKIRTHFGKPVTINSGYRCETHNKRVGGVNSSKHVSGMAADIAVKGVAPAEVAKYAESIGVKGIGLYEGKDGNFVHVDTRTRKGFWYGHAQAKRTTFGGAVKANAGVKDWQKAAIADGYKFPSGADGIWGSECEAVAKKALCKKYAVGYKNKNLTKIVQAVVGVEADGKFGNATKTAVVNWQKSMGLTADGVVGYNTWKKILGV